jgi:DNA primase
VPIQSTTTPSEFAQLLKRTLNIERVVGAYVPSLRPSGASLKGLCPFHNERSPSFYVHPEQGFYKCFGCGRGGDIVTFITEHQKVDFMMALEILAREAGIPLPEFGRGEGRLPEDEKRMLALRELCAWAAEFFIEQMAEHPKGRRAFDYLIGRGLSEAQIREYRLGYAPDSFELLMNTAGRRGWSPELVAEAGLATRNEAGRIYDRFRDRVMFPIADRMGAVVAFGGRVLEKTDDAPKYINSPETPIFRKSQLLYGVSAAREAIREAGGAILMEGYMDWLALHRHGIKHVLAGMGTALTEDQARLIGRLTRKAHLLYDGDEAGQKAMRRGTELLLAQEVRVFAAVLPPEHDPDSLIEAKGTQALRDILTQAGSAVDYFIELAAARHPIKSPEGRSEAIREVAPLLAAIRDPALHEGYLERLAARLRIRLEAVDAELRHVNRRRTRPEAESGGVGAGGGVGFEPAYTLPSRPDAGRSEQILLYILLSEPQRKPLLERLETEWFENDAFRGIYQRLCELEKDVLEGADPPEYIQDAFEDEREREQVRDLLLLPERQQAAVIHDPAVRASAFEQHRDSLRRQADRQWIQQTAQDLASSAAGGEETIQMLGELQERIRAMKAERELRRREKNEPRSTTPSAST